MLRCLPCSNSEGEVSTWSSCTILIMIDFLSPFFFWILRRRLDELGLDDFPRGPSFSVQRRLKLKDTTTGGDEGWLELELAQLGFLWLGDGMVRRNWIGMEWWRWIGRRRQLGQREGTDEEEIDLATGRVFKILPPSLAPWPAHAWLPAHGYTAILHVWRVVTWKPPAISPPRCSGRDKLEQNTVAVWVSFKMG